MSGKGKELKGGGEEVMGVGGGEGDFNMGEEMIEGGVRWMKEGDTK